MSSFLSSKYLKFRDAAARGPIDDDTTCRHCGYILRGLRYGQNCPECGQLIELNASLPDLLTSGSPDERVRWRNGFGLAAICIAIVLLTRIGIIGIAIAGFGVFIGHAYVWTGVANSILWVAAVWLLTPPTLAVRWPWMKPVCTAARVLSLGWVVGCLCMVVTWNAGNGPVPGWVVTGDYGGRLLGAMGLLIVVFICGFLAERADLTTETRRLNAVMWLLWIPTLLAAIFPTTMAWFTVIPLAMVMFFWAWLTISLLLAMIGLCRHVHWAMVHIEAGRERLVRIAEARDELDREAAAKVRSLPKDAR